MDNTMKKIFFILFTLVAFVAYSQSPLTDVNGKVITSATGDILVQEEDPNNFEYTPNAEWIPVNGVTDGEIWILAFDGGTSKLFTITCTTSSGEWQMDIYGGADGKTLLRTYDTTSNVALSHTLVSGTGKYSYTSGYYTYKIVIKPKTVGSDILSIISNSNNTPYLIANLGTVNLTNMNFNNSENMVYVNTFASSKIIKPYGLSRCVNLEAVTMSQFMDYTTNWDDGPTNGGGFEINTKIKQIMFPVSMKSLSTFRNQYVSIFYQCFSLTYIKFPEDMPSLTSMQNCLDGCSNVANISTIQKLSTYSIPFSSTGLRALTTFNQPVLRCSSFTLTGVSNADRSNINYIQIDWANSQFTGNVDIRYNNLSATELNRIFSELPTVVVSRTIYVSSNVGSATCDPTIATAKNWVVITS